MCLRTNTFTISIFTIERVYMCPREPLIHQLVATLTKRILLRLKQKPRGAMEMTFVFYLGLMS